MPSTRSFGFVVLTVFALAGCEKGGEALSVPVPEVNQEPRVVKISKTEITSAEITAEPTAPSLAAAPAAPAPAAPAAAGATDNNEPPAAATRNEE